MNELLLAGRFLTVWKKGRLVLIPKTKKPGQHNDTHASETEEVESKGGLSQKRHGFREGKSTLAALKRVKELVLEASSGPYTSGQLYILITIDVGNALKSAPLEGILKELRKRSISSYLYHMVDDYLDGRMPRLVTALR